MHTDHGHGPGLIVVYKISERPSGADPWPWGSHVHQEYYPGVNQQRLTCYSIVLSKWEQIALTVFHLDLQGIVCTPSPSNTPRLLCAL